MIVKTDAAHVHAPSPGSSVLAGKSLVASDTSGDPAESATIYPQQVGTRFAQYPPDATHAESAIHERHKVTMLTYAVIFLVIALIAAIFGFGGIAASAAGIAQILFWVFLAVALVTFVMSIVRKSPK